MKAIAKLVAFLLLGNLTNLTAQAEFNLTSFDEIIATGGVNVLLEEGYELKATVEVNGLDYDDVRVSVSEGILKIRVLKALVKGDEAKVYVTHGHLRRIKAQAGASIVVRQVLRGDQLALKTNSGGEIEVEVQVNALDVNAAEGGEITVSGSTETLDVRTSSGGDIKAFNLKSNTIYATANTGGNAQVFARESIEASANTGGVIEYKGNPAKTKKKQLLSGKVKEM